MIGYEYTEVNRLDMPHRYMYTKFEGHEFLKSYFDNRSANIKRFQRFSDNVQSANADSQLIIDIISHLELFIQGATDKSDGNWQLFPVSQKNPKCKTYLEVLQKMKGSLRAFDKDKITNTEELLYGILVCQLTGSQEINTKDWLDCLVQRFEVSKKIYECYLPGFRRGSGSAKIVRLYWLFSLSLCIHYMATKNSKYLSTQLKVSDLLCSLSDEQLHNEVSSKEISLVLSIEILFVRLIAKDISGDIHDSK